MERSLAPEHRDGCAVVVFFILAGTKDLVWCKVWDETDGKLAPNETAHGNKAEWEQQWSKDLFFFFIRALYKEGSVNTKKKTSKLFDFHSDRFFCKLLLQAAVFLTCLEDFRLDIWWHFLFVATNDWVTAHFSLMCWRARRSQTFIKIGYENCWRFFILKLK